MKYSIIILLLLAIIQPSFAQRKKKQKDGVTVSMLERNASQRLLIDGLADVLNDRIALASDKFNIAVVKDPTNDAAWFELAKIYGDQNNYIKAQECIDKAIDLQETNVWYRLLQMKIFEISAQYKEMLQSATELVKLKPDNPEFLFELANAQLINEQNNEAIKTLDKVEDIVGVIEEVSMQKQQLYLADKQYDKAAFEIEKLIENNPSESSRYLAMIAEIYNKAGDSDKAAEYYERIVTADPANPYVHISLADFYRNKGQSDKSYKELEAGFANAMLDADTKLRILFAYYTSSEMFTSKSEEVENLVDIIQQANPDNARVIALRGEFLLNSKNYSEARKMFEVALQSDSSNYNIWEGLLQAVLGAQEVKALENYSARTIELFPFQPLPYLFSGMALNQQKNGAEAIKRLNSGLKLVVNNDILKSEFYSQLGDAYNTNQEFTNSDDSYEKALKISPDNSNLLNNYAYYLSLRNANLEKAATMAKKAVDLDPENPANVDTYGWVLYKSGRFEESKIWIEKAIKLTNESDPDLLEHYGDVLFKLGDSGKAVEYWKKAKNAGSSSQNIEKKINDKKIYE